MMTEFVISPLTVVTALVKQFCKVVPLLRLRNSGLAKRMYSTGYSKQKKKKQAEPSKLTTLLLQQHCYYNSIVTTSMSYQHQYDVVTLP